MTAPIKEKRDRTAAGGAKPAKDGVLLAKPKALTREQFARLYKRIVRRIPKTLDLLGK